MDTGGGLRLNIIPEAGGKKRQIATERQHGTATWMPVDVAVEPGKSYRLEFLDKSDSGWGAFTLPVNEPAASHAAKVLGQLSPGLSFITAVALLLLMIFTPYNSPYNAASDKGDVTP